MALKTGPVIKLPRIPFKIDNEEMRIYLQQVESIVRDFVKRVYDDVSNGRMQHRVYTTVPTTSDVEEGEIVFYKSNSTIRLYMNANGTIKYIPTI